MADGYFTCTYMLFNNIFKFWFHFLWEIAIVLIQYWISDHASYLECAVDH